MGIPREGNWAFIHRKLAKSDMWLAEEFTRGQAWVDLIMLAAYKPGHVRIRGVRIDVERGQFATATRFLANRWRWSKGKVIRFLDELETDKRIGTQKNNVSTTITITNYETYQGSGSANGDADRSPDRFADGTQTGSQTGQIEEKNKAIKKETKQRKKGDAPQPPVFVLPPSIRTEAMEVAVTEWLTYKAERREKYTPTGLKKFLTGLAAAVALHGESTIIGKLDKAMGQGWKGWDHADSRGSPSTGNAATTRNGTPIIPMTELKL